MLSPEGSRSVQARRTSPPAYPGSRFVPRELPETTRRRYVVTEAHGNTEAAERRVNARGDGNV